MLKRALEDGTYRETLANSPEPLGLFLRRAGAYFRATYQEIDYTDWNGAIVGSGPGAEIRAAIPPDPDLPYAELEPLLEMGPFARALVARHPSTPLQTILALALDEDLDVQLAVTERPDVPPPVIDRLRRSPYSSVRARFEPLAPPATVVETEQELRQKAEADDPSIRWNVARRPRLPADLMEKLASDPDVDVRWQLATRKDLTEAAFDRLMDQAPAPKVIYALAANPATPEAVIRRLSEVRLPEVTLAASSGLRGPWPLTTSEVRVLLARRAGLPHDMRLAHARDRAGSVRHAVAENVDTDTAILDLLADDPEAYVRSAVARHPRFTSLTLLATDPSPDVCRQIALRSDAPSSALEVLARDPSSAVRELVAARLDTPRPVLERLANDHQTGVRAKATATLAKLAPPATEDRSNVDRLVQALERAGVPVEPARSLVRAVGLENVFLGFGTLTGRVQLLLPARSELLALVDPALATTVLPTRSMLLASVARDGPTTAALVIGGSTTPRDAIEEVGPLGGGDRWLPVVTSLVDAGGSIKNRTRRVGSGEAQGSVTVSFPERTDDTEEATFHAALSRVAMVLDAPARWSAVYDEAGAKTNLSVTTECLPRGPCARLVLRFGPASWDRAIDLVKLMTDIERARSAAVFMGFLASGLAVTTLRGVDAIVDPAEPDLVVWMATPR